MIRRWLLATLLLVLPTPLLAQDAHSLGIGFAATAAPMDYFGIYWNPACLAVPGPGPTWTIATGGSFFDTSNSGTPILRFNNDNAIQSGVDPVNRYQQYLGTFGAKYTTAAGGVIYNQELNSSSSQGALAFFNDRDKNLIAGSGNTYGNLNYAQTSQQIYNVVVSYASQLPIGTIPFFAAGGSLKYHDGVQYQQTSLVGTYQQSTPGTGYTYTKTTSTSGLGLSIDAGFLAKFTDALQVGMMFQNLQSNFNWQAQQQNYVLDGSGKESASGPATNVTVAANFPYATKLGLLGSPPGTNVALEGEVAWTQGVVNWRAGLERYYPDNHLVVRLGTFNDRVSNSQMWTIGGGYLVPNFGLNLSFLTRSLPAIQDSITFGMAFDATVRF
jgi:hypothetical protein